MTQKLVQAIKLAKESIKDLGLDDIEKQVAMAKAIDYYLAQDEGVVVLIAEKKPPQSDKSSFEQKPENEVELFWKKLESASEAKINKLKDIFSLKDGKVTLILPEIKGENIAFKQCSAATLILYAYNTGLEIEWVDASLAVESLKDSGVSQANFSRNLDKQSNWFRKRGTKKGLNYKLSGAGIAEAKTYLASL